LLFNPLMRSTFAALVLVIAIGDPCFGQDQESASSPGPPRRGLFGRMLHPFSVSAPIPRYKDVKLDGLVLDLQIRPQPVKLSEVRQLEVKAILTTLANKPTTLDFLNDQRVEIYLRNSTEAILTKWSDNHAPKETPGTLVINPQENIEYKETIATRELAPNKVYIAEVFFPKYPELRARQKFMTAP
jgi:Intracellular proteinase inhibitor